MAHAHRLGRDILREFSEPPPYDRGLSANGETTIISIDEVEGIQSLPPVRARRR